MSRVEGASGRKLRARKKVEGSSGRETTDGETDGRTRTESAGRRPPLWLLFIYLSERGGQRRSLRFSPLAVGGSPVGDVLIFRGFDGEGERKRARGRE